MNSTETKKKLHMLKGAGEIMNKEELTFILNQGEGQFIEFKEHFDKSIAKEIVAFANSQGGKIFIGISDDRKAKGITITNSLKSQVQDIAKHCDPSIKIAMTEFENILIVDVREGDDKPYACGQGFFIRTGPNSQKLTRDEIIDFSISEGKIRFDEQINEEFSYPQDFDEAKLDEYLKLAELTKNIAVEDILLNLKVAKKIEGKLKFNNAGILFFAKNPEKFFFVSKVVCVNFQNNERINILDKKIFDNGIISNIQEAVNYVKKHINVEFVIKDLPRKEIPQYPLEAYREAIVNAVMHRDYFQKSGDITVEVFRNKLWICNPGGLVKWLKPEDLGKGSKPRNHLIAELLSKTEYVEKVGSGINRIKDAMKKLNLSPPIFEYNHTFRIILNDKTEGVGEKDGVSDGVKDGVSDGVRLSKNQAKIREIIEKNKYVTREELAKEVGITVRNVEKNLSQLKERGLLKRVGPDKGGHWEIVK